MQEYTARVWLKGNPNPFLPFRRIKRYALSVVARSAVAAARDVYMSESKAGLFGERLVWVEAEGGGECARNGDLDLFRDLARRGETEF